MPEWTYTSYSFTNIILLTSSKRETVVYCKAIQKNKKYNIAFRVYLNKEL